MSGWNTGGPGDGDDTFVGTPGNDTPGTGQGGSDSMAGLDGNDFLRGGGDSDTLLGGAGDDTLRGDGGADSLEGGEGQDSLSGGSGADMLRGGAGDDTLAGTGGGDTIDGGTGSNWVDYRTSPGGVTVNLGTGANGGQATGDSILAGSIQNVLGSAGAADRLTGDGQDNILVGGGGNDTLAGGGGADTLQGGAGADSMLGGDGADSIAWRAGDGADTIDLGTGADTLDLQGWNAADTAADAWSVALSGTTATFTGDASVGNAVLTVLNYDPADSVVCFAEGTRILTPSGEVPVERLRAGDLVVTPRGAAPVSALRWVGRLQVDLTRQRFRGEAAPVLVRAGALADGLPFRDLHVSPNHALFLDGVLVPARLLVNGLSIIHQRWRQAVTYHHLELDAHALLVSEGALTESYLDDGNRHLFDHPGLLPLDAGFATRRGGRAVPCAVVLQDGDAALRRIRLRLGARAGRLQARRGAG
jgi:Ca2+-binding RTX toxin-like protein